MDPHGPRPVVVFDLDGTIADTIPLILASYRHAFEQVVGEVPPEAELRSWIGQPLIRTFRAGWPERADELFTTYVAWNRAHTAELIRRYDGVTEVLADLAAAGARVAVATSKMRDIAATCTELVGAAPYLGALVGLEDTTEHKPDPAPLLEAVARVGGTPGGATYVGDAVVDVLAAQAAGMASVAVSWGAESREALAAARPDHLVDTAEQLRAVLLGDGPVAAAPGSAARS
ncbi:HAD family hydrolase [Lapillicoccus jejuensis]|uniref:Pyrophosphatase PpaX n=1 Tax=Lapillicoccus jejuensis TaxID=402171 RepID=A0A542E0Q3_9MICO|nr:HAD hydrolase-like protein [Lapillicoccus jejuensis]TQJ08923.1 pyrophosphatase PpaX [Lapillicoccus jejuensis]